MSKKQFILKSIKPNISRQSLTQDRTEGFEALNQTNDGTISFKEIEPQFTIDNDQLSLKDKEQTLQKTESQISTIEYPNNYIPAQLRQFNDFMLIPGPK
jgi:hypothetical protein